LRKGWNRKKENETQCTNAVITGGRYDPGLVDQRGEVRGEKMK